ncbi:MAG TPA: M43 family zinc metalloprotease [Ferruginibacter sp.]|jgi:hypothetical protein|nr:T9SS type A sorting domain-containing protein [Chitinophagaceae bacterium]MBP6046802.1 T9SS type A sorting domain-containing protein [Ferruginibacter sp.]MBK7735569.1 T9SS type A sorting domain-containing protein [Chitinophagaceae bacterium]MBK8928262.1 T9SS type A sorting domain-containing protein [Chitinophagaceae bacterium]MBP6371427.1 T9SS type A sorting domain-containing protein [Ferruginibacter sp.]
MKFIFGLIIFLLNSFILKAQRICATDFHALAVMQSNNRIFDNSGTSLRDTVPNEIINIPVVVHVLYNTTAQNISDEQILSQIAVLNKDYRKHNSDAINVPAVFKNKAADCRINFCLAKVAPGGYSTSGIVRKYTGKNAFPANDDMKFSSKGGANAWDSRQYLNIWVCNMQSRVLGYATTPGGDLSKDGVVISYTAFGTIGNLQPEFTRGRTTTHEVGHWLGLKHIWGDANCGSDDVDDTPPQYYRNFYCPSFPRVSLCSVNENGDMFMNFMDLTDDDCMNMFTYGQKNKMRAFFAKGNSRNGILNSYVCDGSLATAGPLPVDTTSPVNNPNPVTQVNIKLFTNPVSNTIEIGSNNADELQNKELRLFTVHGKLLHKEVLGKATHHSISAIHLPAGIYILNIGNGKAKAVFKVIKL